MTGKYLITTDNWFIAPDGKQYKAVWGDVKPMTALAVLGVEPNRNSANWMLQVGTDTDHVILAGCQIHYAVSCPDKPHQGETSQRFGDSDTPSVRDNSIYIPGLKEDPSKLSPDQLKDLSLFLSNIIRDGGDMNIVEELVEDIKRIGVLSYEIRRNPYERIPHVTIKWATGAETTEYF